MEKINVCVLFGGVSPEHEVSLRSAEAVLNHIDQNKYNIFPVGITKAGKWLLFQSSDYAMIADGSWYTSGKTVEAHISPAQGEGLLIKDKDKYKTQPLNVVFPIMHGENCEDGAIQGLLKLADIPYVGPHVSASAVSMDKSLTKLVVSRTGIRQADWVLARKAAIAKDVDNVVSNVESKFIYPVFVKPAGTGSSVGVSKAKNQAELIAALQVAAKYDEKVLIEEFVDGREVEVAVIGNQSPEAATCGEIDSGADFYDYDTKYITNTSRAYIPARIPQNVQDEVRSAAVKIYKEIGCQGLSRVDFFVKRSDNSIVFNEINTIPGFTSISMYPKLFQASGVEFTELIDRLITLAQEAK